MKILMVNKFLYRGGGSETYMLTLGDYLTSLGHEVQYFGMDSEDRCVSNRAEAYTSFIDFRKVNPLQKVQFSLKTIYSAEARRKIRQVIEDFQPDIVHMNNINFQLTPSVIYEIKKYHIPIVQTLHDVQIACPNHRFYIEEKEMICTECVDSGFSKCIKNRCVHASLLQSIFAFAESSLYHRKNTYNLVDTYICPSYFIADVVRKSGVEDHRLKVMHNFSSFDTSDNEFPKKSDYALYFGRLSVEKGLKTLLNACEELPDIKFVIAGSGPLEEELKNKKLKNVQFVGFKSGEELKELIMQAQFSLYPSEWYENCPMSVLESIALSTPVIASDIGGTKELIEEGKTGFTFKTGNKEELKEKILGLYNNTDLINHMSRHCVTESRNNTIDIYTKRLLGEYQKLIKQR